MPIFVLGGPVGAGGLLLQEAATAQVGCDVVWDRLANLRPDAEVKQANTNGQGQAAEQHCSDPCDLLLHAETSSMEPISP
jgi:hypothetical protein